MAKSDKDLDLSEADRYDSAAGWEPDAELEQKKRLAVEHWNTPYSEVFDIKNGRELRRSAIKPVSEIFPPFWREGELCVLTGEGSVGKSLFATQLAECIARGENYFTKESDKIHKRKLGRRIIYIDFERTRTQFDELYSARGRRYPFASRFKHAPINPDMNVSKEYEGKLWKLFRDQVGALAAKSEQHNLIVIDNVDYLSPTDGRSGVSRTLKTLKFWTQTLNCSILAAVHARSRTGSLRSLSVNDMSGNPHALRFADSVFAIGHTPIGPEYRYLKQLRSRSAPPIYDDNNVAVFELKRMAKAGFASNVTRADKKILLESGKEPRTTNYELQKFDPAFLGFEFQGTAPESLMLRDLAAEAELADRAEERRRLAEAKRVNRLRQTSARTALTEGIIDGSFNRYMLGE